LVAERHGHAVAVVTELAPGAVRILATVHEITQPVSAEHVVGEWNPGTGPAVGVIGALGHAGVGEDITGQAPAAGTQVTRAVFALLVTNAFASTVFIADEIFLRASFRGRSVQAVLVATALVAPEGILAADSALRAVAAGAAAVLATANQKKNKYGDKRDEP
jgi:hypothetical protein